MMHTMLSSAQIIKVGMVAGAIALIAAVGFLASTQSDTPPLMTTPTPAPSPTASSSLPEQTQEPQSAATGVQIAVILLEDKGLQGKRIGCDDSVVLIQATGQGGGTNPELALRTLLNTSPEQLERGQYYTAFQPGNLTLESFTLENGTATASLTGDLTFAGVCDEPRFEAQLRETLLHYPQISRVRVRVNGESLDTLLKKESE